jgi:hypothetical protein
VRIIFRPLLVSGMLATDEHGVVMLIDSGQPESEQAVALWHEVLHMLGLFNENQVEAMAQRLGAVCPEIVAMVRA